MTNVFVKKINSKLSGPLFTLLQAFTFIVMFGTILLLCKAVYGTPFNPALMQIDPYEAEFLIRTEDVEKVFIIKETNALFIDYQGHTYISEYDDYESIVETTVNYASSPLLKAVNLDATSLEVIIAYEGLMTVVLAATGILLSLASGCILIGVVILRCFEKIYRF